MPVITKIAPQKRRPRRHNVYLDGHFAFGCHANVLARFRLRAGMELGSEKIKQIEAGEIFQECLDKALAFVAARMHSRSELRAKLKRHDWPEAMIQSALDRLAAMGYLDDAKFAVARTTAAAHRKHHGPRRARMELMRAGIQSDVAERAVREVYAQTDSLSIARQLALKQTARLRKLDPPTARRRLAGMLQRRGFDYETIRPLIDEVLGEIDPGAPK